MSRISLVLLVGFCLSVQRIALAFLPFNFYMKLNNWLVSKIDQSPFLLSEMTWAICGISRRFSIFTCLTQAATLRLLLGKQSNSKIVIGVKKDQSGNFQAHAWLVEDNKIILGEDRTFNTIAECP